MDVVEDGWSDHDRRPEVRRERSSHQTQAPDHVDAAEPAPRQETPGERDRRIAVGDALAVASLVLAVGAVLAPSTWFYLWSMRSRAFYSGADLTAPVRTFLGVAGGHAVLAVAAVVTAGTALRIARRKQPRWIAACAGGGLATGLVVLLLFAAGALWSFAFPPEPPPPSG